MVRTTGDINIGDFVFKVMLVHCYGSDHQTRIFSLIFLNVCITSLDSMVKKPVCATKGNICL